LTGTIPWKVIHDPTRPVETWDFDRDPSTFIRREIDGFLKNYYRDLQQSQPNHIEIVAEKNTIESIIRPVASDYCIPYVIERGNCSMEPRYQVAERYRKSGREYLILLILGDFDADGESIVESFARSLRDDFGITNIRPIKVALNARQAAEMHLPHDVDPKKGSNNWPKFLKKYGANVRCYELEAIPPEQLQQILRDAIDEVMDLDAFNAELDKEHEDAARLEEIRRQVAGVLGEVRLGDEEE
jgi:hypothetical protein